MKYRKVIISDDDAMQRRILDHSLSGWGFEVTITSNGREALQALRDESEPCIAILDWMMPEVSGIDVCRVISEEEPDKILHLIILTSKQEKSDTVEALEAGADDYIIKPFDNDELRARVNVGSRIIELQSALDDRVKELQDKVDHIKRLQGIIPICMHCHKIRNDEESWERIEQYITEHTEAKLSHGICPECVEEHYPGYSKREDER